jgi:hypothetical protein
MACVLEYPLILVVMMVLGLGHDGECFLRQGLTM